MKYRQNGGGLFALAIVIFLVSLNCGGAKAAPSSGKTKSHCIFEDYEDLRQAWPRIQHRQLHTTTNTMGAGSQAQIVLSGEIGFPKDYVGSKSMSDLDFRAFFVKTADLPAYAQAAKRTRPPGHPVEGDARLIQEDLSLSPDLAKRLDLDAKKNQLLQVDVPVRAGEHILPQPRRLVLLACGQGAEEPLFWAEAPVKVTPFWPPIIAGIILDVLLYLGATTWVYLARRRSVEEARAPSATPVFRIEPVVKWTWFRCLDPVVLTSDVFDRGSLSKLQILFFLLLVAYGLAYITIRTGELSSISTTVVYLLGISAFGALGTKVAGTTRDRLSSENWAWLVSRKVLPINDPGREGRPRWTDLVMSDSELDIYKLQALVFTVIVGVGMIAGGFSLATFSVPQELLEILGLSQLVFVGGRLAKPATLGDLDDLLSELRKREDELRRAAASGIDVDADGKPALDAAGKPLPPKPGFPFKTLDEVRDNVPNALRRYTTTADEVNVLLRSLANRSVDTAILKVPQIP